MSLTKRQPLVTKENMVTKATEAVFKELNSGNGVLIQYSNIIYIYIYKKKKGTCILQEMSHAVWGIYEFILIN